jgi:hypothetical protein
MHLGEYRGVRHDRHFSAASSFRSAYRAAARTTPLEQKAIGTAYSRHRWFHDVMSMNDICPKCQGQMEVGFVGDYDSGAVMQTSWIEGAPKRNFLGMMSLRDKRQIAITIQRCTACGFLESFAKA